MLAYVQITYVGVENHYFKIHGEMSVGHNQTIGATCLVTDLNKLWDVSLTELNTIGARALSYSKRWDMSVGHSEI